MAQQREEKNPFITIPATMVGVFLVIAVLFLLLARDSLDELASIAWAFAALGSVTSLIAYWAQRR